MQACEAQMICLGTQIKLKGTVLMRKFKAAAILMIIHSITELGGCIAAIPMILTN
jgi:hypothetical protein